MDRMLATAIPSSPRRLRNNRRRPSSKVRMELLRPDDPSRRLMSAARSARGIGTLQIGLAILIFVLAIIFSPRNRNPIDRLAPTFLVCLVLLAAPGTLSIVFGSFIQRRKRWAVICMIILASVELLPLAVLLSQAAMAFSLPLMIVTGLFVAA